MRITSFHCAVSHSLLENTYTGIAPHGNDVEAPRKFAVHRQGRTAQDSLGRGQPMQRKQVRHETTTVVRWINVQLGHFPQLLNT